MAPIDLSPASHPTDRLVGTSSIIATLRAQIRHLVAFDTVGSTSVPTVLLQGETGTGKGLVARVMHDSGPRASGPFLDVNCAAIPETMLEAELFGFEPGAFTDAKRAKPGLFEAASGGTLFLDEIDTLTLPLQGKLLTAMETKRMRRLGAVAERTVDVKLIVATNAALPERVTAGRFRADLYHRLAVVVLALPPLRVRGEDILVLAEAFLRHYTAAHGVSSKRLQADAETWLRSYAWPGNVRELSHVMERVTLLHVGEAVSAETLAQLCPLLAAPVALEAAPLLPTIAPETTLPVEAEQIRQALVQTGGNVVQAARILGVSRGTLRYRMHRYGIESWPQMAPLLPALPCPAGENAIEPPQATAQPEQVSAERRTPAGTGPDGDAPAPGWEHKPVVVLALELTWPEDLGLAPLSYEPWTAAARWEQSIIEKVQGSGGVLLQRTASLLTWVFGLPQALEQLPQRAVHSALAIRQMMAEGRAPDLPPCPEVRYAVHLGAVRVESRVPVSTARVLAVGEALALPVRLLGQVEAGEIAVSPEIERLIEGWVTLEARALRLRSRQPAHLGGAVVVGISPEGATPGDSVTRPRSPFVGRERELVLLEAVLEQVKDGHGQSVGLVGVPGIGKSRLLAELSPSLRAQHIAYREGRCLAYGSAIPYLPVLGLLRHHCSIAEGDCPETLTAKVRLALEQSGSDPAVGEPVLLQLLGVPGSTHRLAALSPEARRTRTFETLRQLFLTSSQQQPLVLAVDDLHWIDPTSEAFLALLVERLAGAPLLVLTTYRPGYRPPWLDKSYVTQLALPSLDLEASRQVVHGVLSHTPLASTLEQQLLEKAEGNPFFLEELAYTVREQEKHSPVLVVPDTIQAVLAARLDRLPMPEKRLLQIAAVLGRDITLPMLQALTALPEETLRHSLTHLQAAEFLSARGFFPTPTYTFKHILIQEVAYQSMPASIRRQDHQRIVQVLVEQFPALAETRPALLAHHCTEAGDTARAIAAWQRAGQRAAERCAYLEAMAHFTRGLELLQHLPDTRERTQQELALHTALGPALIATRGYAALEVEQSYARARALCQELEETPQLFPVLFGLWMFYLVRANPLQTARELAFQLLDLAHRQADPALLLEAHMACGMLLYHWGEPAAALAHLEAGQTLYDPQQHQAHTFLYGQDPGIACLTYGAVTLWLLGYPDQALARSRDALSLAQVQAHPFNIAFAHFFASVLHQLRREPYLAQAQAEALLALAAQHDFAYWVAQGTILRGWALAVQGQGEEGLAQIRRGLVMHQTVGSAVANTCWLGLLADVYRTSGQTADGLAAVAEGLALGERSGEQFYTAELYRLQGEISQQAGGTGQQTPEGPSSPEACVQRALAIARQQGAKALELRAAMSLSRLWQQQGKRQAAYNLLTPVYDWFTEGFATADLQEARALLDELACTMPGETPRHSQRAGAGARVTASGAAGVALGGSLCGD